MTNSISALPLPYTAILPAETSIPPTSFFAIFGTTSSLPSTLPPYYSQAPSVLIRTHIIILRLLVLSALLFALIPVLALLAAIVPPPAPAVLTLISACAVFPTATFLLYLAVRRMREEEQRVRREQAEIDMTRCYLPDYADAEPLPAYSEPKPVMENGVGEVAPLLLG